MKNRLTEFTVSFYSILKWFVLATIVGIIAAFSTAAFLIILRWSVKITSGNKYYFLLMPAGMFISGLLIELFAKEAEGHGTEKVIEAIHKNKGKIRLIVVPVKLLATIFTIATGGSVGKEGPSAQIGGGLASFLGDILKFKGDTYKKLVICGISASFAVVLGSPIGGAIFGVEVLFIGGMMYEVLFPSFVSGIIAYQISVALGIENMHIASISVPNFSIQLMLKVFLSGIFFGIVAFILVEFLNLMERLSKGISIWRPFKGLIGGAVLALVTLAISSPAYLGLGMHFIEQTVAGAHVSPLAFLLKIFYTTTTLSFQGSGGIVRPIFFIGSTSGNVFGQVFGNPSFYAAIGIAAVLAGAANVPISASIMAIELFGPGIGLYAAFASIVSFILVGNRSVYPTQILQMRKTEFANHEPGGQISEYKPSISLEETSLISHLYKLFKSLFKKQTKNNK